jgi:ligand-binding sensor domain-containing protein
LKQLLKYKFLVLVLSYVLPVFGQNRHVNLEHLSTNEGLPQGFVVDIAQDKNGMMWLATKLGIAKYDGYKFSNIAHSEDDSTTISSNDILQINIDKENALWLAHANGCIDAIDLNTMQVYKALKFNNYYISANNFGLLKNENAKQIFIINNTTLIKPIKQNNLLKDSMLSENVFVWDKTISPVHSKILNEQQLLLVSQNVTEGKIYFCKHTLNSKSSYYFELPFTGIVYYSFMLSKDELFIGGESSSVIIDVNTGKPINKNYTHTTGAKVKDANNNIWSFGNKLNYYDFKSGKNIELELTNKNIYYFFKSPLCIKSTYIDHQSNLWLGTNGFGILKIMPNNLAFNLTREDNRRDLYEVCALGNDSVFLYQNLMSRIFIKSSANFADATLFNKEYTEATSAGYRNFIGNEIIYCDSNKKLVKVINLKTNAIKKYSLQQPVPGQILHTLINHNNEVVISIYLNHSIWLLMYNKEGALIKNIDLKLYSSDYKRLVYFFEEVKPNMYLISTISGIAIYYFNKQKLVNYTKQNGLSSNAVICSYYNKANQILWAGTEGAGLNEIDLVSNKIKIYNTTNGLANNVVYRIEATPTSLWLSTNNGLSQMNLGSKIFANYGEYDGLQGNEFNRLASCISSNGEVWFGGLYGINYFKEENIVYNSNIP